MFARKLNAFNGLFVAGNFKNLINNDTTYCKFFCVKSVFMIPTFKVHSRKIHDAPQGFSKKITRLNYSDGALSNIMLQVKSKKMRKKTNLIYFEGKRLLRDALNAGIIPLHIYFSRKEDISALNIPEETQLLKVPYNDLKIWSDLTTCPGILTVCRRPDVLNEYDPSIPVSIICDNIRDPGNLGSIIRNSAGAGVKNVYLSKGCIDLWDSKVLRGGMGAHFRIPLYNEMSWDDLSNLVNKETFFLIATNQKEKCDSNAKNIVPYYHLSFKDYKDITLVIGGETEGISSCAYNMAKSFNFQSITIPLCNAVESLNSVSALSVLLYEIKRQFDTSSFEKS